MAQVAEGDAADIDRAVARRARRSGRRPVAHDDASERGRMIWRISDLIEENADELAQLESLDNGKPFAVARAADVPLAADMFRYMAGWATKIEGKHHPDLGAPRAGRVPRLHAARAGRRRRPDHPLELPAADGGLEAGAGAGHRLHGRAEAGRADAAVGAAPGRADPGSRLPDGVVNIVTGFGETPARRWPRTPASTRSPSPARPRSAS